MTGLDIVAGWFIIVSAAWFIAALREMIRG